MASFGAWQLLKAKHANSDEALFRLPDWVEFSKVNTNRVFSRYEDAKKIRKIIESVPDWLDALGEAELGAENGTMRFMPSMIRLPLYCV